MDGTRIILDAGTGIRNIPEAVLREPELSLLMTHVHLDHLIGLPMFPYLFRDEARLSVYVDGNGGSDLEERMTRLFSPPYWPFALRDVPANVTFVPMKDAMRIRNIRVDRMRGHHPDGVSIFRLTGRKHTVMFATDCTITEDNRQDLIQFARDCDLLLIDGQYSEEEWDARQTYGHNPWTEAARLGAEAGAKRIRIIHHDPQHTDAVLSSVEASARALWPSCLFAKEGEVIFL